MKLKEFMANTLPRARGKSKRKQQQQQQQQQQQLEQQQFASTHAQTYSHNSPIQTSTCDAADDTHQRVTPQAPVSVHVNKYVARGELIDINNREAWSSPRDFSDPLFVNLNFGERQSKCACYKHVIIDGHNFPPPPPLQDKNADVNVNCLTDFYLSASWTENNYNTLPRARPRIKTNPWLPSPKSSPNTSPGSSRTNSSAASSPVDSNQADDNAAGDPTLEKTATISAERDSLGDSHKIYKSLEDNQERPHSLGDTQQISESLGDSIEISEIVDFFPDSFLTCSGMPSPDCSVMTSMTSDSGRFSMTGSGASSLVSSMVSDYCEPMTTHAPSVEVTTLDKTSSPGAHDETNPSAKCNGGQSPNECRPSGAVLSPTEGVTGDKHWVKVTGKQEEKEVDDGDDDDDDDEPNFLAQFKGLIPDENEEGIDYEELFEKNIELVTSESAFSFDQCIFDTEDEEEEDEEEEEDLDDDFLQPGVDIFAEECTDEFLFRETNADFDLERNSDSSELSDIPREDHSNGPATSNLISSTPEQSAFTCMIGDSYYHQLAEAICQDAIHTATLDIKNEICSASPKISSPSVSQINSITENFGENGRSGENSSEKWVGHNEAMVHDDTTTPVDVVKENLQDKIQRLRAGRRIIEEKIREAQEEEQLRYEQRMRFHRQITLHRKEMLLKTLEDLRGQLAAQCSRLQTSYNNVLEMQRHILRRNSHGDPMLTGSTFELTV